MKFEIAKYIAELLHQYGHVKVPGLGTFVTYKQPSTAADANQRISPPSTTTNFTSDANVDKDILLKQVMHSGSMDLYAATKFISEQVEKIKNAIKIGELVYLDDIGHIYMTNRGAYSFLPEKTSFEDNSLSQLELEPLTDEEIQFAKTRKMVAPKKKRFNMRKQIATIAPIAAVLLACVLTFSIWQNNKSSNNVIGQEKFSKVPVRVNTKPTLEKVIIPEEKEVVENKTDLDGTFESEVDTEAATVGPKAKECVIIVGQFRNKDGVELRVSQIYDFGYAAYQDTRNGLTRVGVQFAYEKQADINRTLKKVQKRFDNKAWILKQ